MCFDNDRFRAEEEEGGGGGGREKKSINTSYHFKHWTFQMLLLLLIKRLAEFVSSGMKTKELAWRKHFQVMKTTTFSFAFPRLT